MVRRRTLGLRHGPGLLSLLGLPSVLVGRKPPLTSGKEIPPTIPPHTYLRGVPTPPDLPRGSLPTLLTGSWTEYEVREVSGRIKRGKE